MSKSELTLKGKIQSKLLNKITAIQKMGDGWDEEFNTPGPSHTVIDFSKKIIQSFVEKNFIPYRISQSTEEGICFYFENKNKRLYLEFYNDGDIGFIIEDFIAKKILNNKDIDNNEIISILTEFFS